MTCLVRPGRCGGRSTILQDSVPGARAGRYRPPVGPYRSYCAQRPFYAVYHTLHPRRAHGPCRCELVRAGGTRPIPRNVPERLTLRYDQLTESQVAYRAAGECSADTYGAAIRHQFVRSQNKSSWNFLSYDQSERRTCNRRLVDHPRIGWVLRTTPLTADGRPPAAHILRRRPQSAAASTLTI